MFTPGSGVVRRLPWSPERYRQRGFARRVASAAWGWSILVLSGMGANTWFHGWPARGSHGQARRRASASRLVLPGTFELASAELGRVGSSAAGGHIEARWTTYHWPRQEMSDLMFNENGLPLMV